MSAWTSPLDLHDDSVDFARNRVDEDAERARARGTYAASARARALGGIVDADDAPDVCVVAVGSDAARAIALGCARACEGTRRGAVVTSASDAGGRATRASALGEWARFGSACAASVTTIHVGRRARGTGAVAIAETRGDVSGTCARAWARETLRACGVRGGSKTKVLALTSCSETETSEAEMTAGEIDRVVAYGLDTGALRAELEGSAWPAPPRAYPVGRLLESVGASALMSACDALGVAARVVAIPESEPVRVLYCGADLNAVNEAAAHASALLGRVVEHDYKPRLAPMRAENVYA